MNSAVVVLPNSSTVLTAEETEQALNSLKIVLNYFDPSISINYRLQAISIELPKIKSLLESYNYL